MEHTDVTTSHVKTIVGFELDQMLFSLYPMTKRKKWFGHSRLGQSSWWIDTSGEGQPPCIMWAFFDYNRMC